jgi:SAM-dependent methyltransferase
VTARRIQNIEAAMRDAAIFNRAVKRAMNFREIDLSDKTPGLLSMSGFSGPEKRGRWTDGPKASLSFALPADLQQRDIAIKIDALAFTWRDQLPEQRVEIAVNGGPAASWILTDAQPRRRAFVVDRTSLVASRLVEVEFSIPTCKSPASLGVNEDRRLLGVMIGKLLWAPLAAKPPADALFWQFGRPVGGESSKSYDQKIETGFWSRFVTGPSVLDIGFKGYIERGFVPIMDGAIGIDLDYPGYDGRILPFADGTQDAVYSSHCLEHIADYITAIQEWHRVTKIGGHIITAVPSAQLYERKRRPPSKHNQSHMRHYTPASLLAEFETALPPNSYRVRYLAENDAGYDYDLPPDRHPTGCYEVELVIQKIAAPPWRLED